MDNVLSDRLEGRIALVTGGSGGIGRATCLALAAKGAAVAVHYHARHDAADEVVSAIREAGGQAVALVGDLTDAAVPDALVQAAVDAFGGLHILVNNAGEMTDVAVAGMSDAVWERALTLNLTAAFRCARAAIPAMRAAGWGRLVNVTSQAAYTGSAYHAHYAAAKAGLSGLTFSLAKELAADAITVNLVTPGRIETDMLTGRSAGREAEWLRQTPLGRLGQPEEVASAIAFLASPAAAYITGAMLHVNGGLVMG